MARRLRLRPAAEADLDAIYEFIARDSPGNALAFVRRIQHQCVALLDFPERGTRRDDAKEGLRTFAFERRVLIAFYVLPQEVEIARILYGGRDLNRIFERH
jgi:toxin ParE1/3/4